MLYNCQQSASAPLRQGEVGGLPDRDGEVLCTLCAGEAQGAGVERARHATVVGDRRPPLPYLLVHLSVENLYLMMFHRGSGMIV